MKDIAVRPFKPQDRKQLDLFRMQYEDADLEIPHGYQNGNVETVIAEKNGEIVSSLTGSLCIVFDPFIKNPDARPLDVLASLHKLESVLSYLGAKHGAVDIFIAVPNQLKEYHEILKKVHYEETVQNCTVFRKPLVPDVEPLIGEIRDQFSQLQSSDADTIGESPKATLLPESASV